MTDDDDSSYMYATYHSSPQEGKMSGHGVLDYDEDKRKYVGGFLAGLKHGKGEYYFPNGSR